MYITSEQIAELIERQNEILLGLGHGASQEPQSQDPRVAGVRTTRDMVAQMAGAAPDYLAGGAVLAAEFGYGPKVISPWSGTISAFGAGSRSAGLMGGIGAGAAAATGYYAGGALLNNLGYQPFRQGANMQQAATASVQSMMPNIGHTTASSIGASVNASAYGARTTTGDMLGVLSAGIGSGSIDMSSMSKFQSSFSQLISQVQTVAGALRSSLTEAQAAMSSFQSVGFSPQESVGLTLGARLMAGSGMSPLAATNAMSEGIQLAKATGSDPMTGALGSLRQAGILNHAMAGNFVPGMTHQEYGQFSGAASRFMSSQQGGTFLAAIMDPETGGLNRSVAQRIATGAMSGSDIRSLAAQNKSGNMDLFMSSRQELAGQYLSEFGPASTHRAITALTEGNPYSSTQAQSISGLSRRGLDMMGDFASSEQLLEQRVRDAAKQGFQEGTGHPSLGQTISAIADTVVLDPIRRKMRNLGASVSRSVTGAISDLETQAWGGGQMGSMSGGGGAATLAGMMHSGAAGIRHPLDNFPEIASSEPSLVAREARGIGKLVPPAFRLADYTAGTTHLDFPMMGLAQDEWNPWMTGAAAGMGLTALAGASPISAVGRGVSSFGQYASGLFKGSTGLFGGAARLGAGLLPRMAGLGIQGIGRVLRSKPIAGLALGADTIINSLPHLLREAGLMDENPEITGTNARLVKFYDEVSGGKLLTDRSDSLDKLGSGESQQYGVAGTDGKVILSGQLKKMSELERSIHAASPEDVYRTFGGRDQAETLVRQALNVDSTGLGALGVLSKRTDKSKLEIAKLMAAQGLLGGTDRIKDRSGYHRAVQSLNESLSKGYLSDKLAEGGFDFFKGDRLQEGATGDSPYLGSLLSSNAGRFASGITAMGGKASPEALQDFTNKFASAVKDSGQTELVAETIYSAQHGPLSESGQRGAREKALRELALNLDMSSTDANRFATLVTSGVGKKIFEPFSALAAGGKRAEAYERITGFKDVLKKEAGDFGKSVRMASRFGGLDYGQLGESVQDLLNTGDENFGKAFGERMSKSADVFSTLNDSELEDVIEALSEGGTMGGSLAMVASNVRSVKSHAKRSGKDPLKFLAGISGKDSKQIKRLLGGEDELSMLKLGPDDDKFAYTAAGHDALEQIARSALRSRGVSITDDNISTAMMEIQRATAAVAKGDHAGAAASLKLLTSASGISAAAGASAAPEAYRQTMEDFVYYIGQANSRFASMLGGPQSTSVPTDR